MTMRQNLTMLTVALALLVSPSAAQELFPFTGHVTGTDVYVRSGPGANAYAVGKVNAPMMLTVLDRSGDWLKIRPPAGVFSIMSKQYVATTDGRTGTVTGDRVRVRAGTDLADLGGTTNHWAFQQFLNKGAMVTILGEGVDFYKIVPPDQSFVWISAQFVSTTPGGAVEPVGPVTPPGPPDQPVTPPVQPVEPVAPSTDDAMAAYKEAELALKAEFEKPFDQRDFAPLLARYRSIHAPAGTPLAGAVTSRTVFLTDAIERRRQWQRTRQGIDQTQQTQAELDRQREELARQRREQELRAAQPGMVARGVVRDSDVFTGYGRPLRYILADPTTGKTTAYAECSTGYVDLSQYIGQNIGVYGKVTRGDSRSEDLVDVERVVPLGGASAIPRPEGEIASPGELPVTVPDIVTPPVLQPDNTAIGIEGLPEGTIEGETVRIEADDPDGFTPVPETDRPAEPETGPDGLAVPELPATAEDEVHIPARPERPERPDIDRELTIDVDNDEIRIEADPDPLPDPEAMIPAVPEVPEVPTEPASIPETQSGVVIEADMPDLSDLSEPLPEVDERPSVVEEVTPVVPDRPSRIVIDTDADLSEPPKPWLDDAPEVPAVPETPAPPADVIEAEPVPEVPDVPRDDFRIIRPPVVEDENVDEIDIDEDEYQ